MPAEERPTTSEPQKLTDSSGLGQPPLPRKRLLLITTFKTIPGLCYKYCYYCPLPCEETGAQKLSDWPKVTQLASSPMGIQGTPSDSKSLTPQGS